MKITKKLLLLITIPFVLLLFFRAALLKLIPNGVMSNAEVHIPIVKGILVQKVQIRKVDGTNLKMKIIYANDGVAMSSSLPIYTDGAKFTTFYDNGVAPDEVAGDRVYTAYIKEDLLKFREEVMMLESAITANGGVSHFRGHVGEYIPATSINKFNFTKFDNFEEVPLSLHLLDVALCGQGLLKQNSLFITDLDVVEDPARTFNVVTRQGNPQGVWTFGHLIKNIANQPLTGVSAKTFLKNWLKGWMHDRTVNGQVVAKRRDAYHYLIAPWIQRARELGPSPMLPNYYKDVPSNYTSWESDWDATPEDSLLKYAPFKLMAIVNRLDLRGNSGYAGSAASRGETRFIYTLINPLNTVVNFGAATNPGMPPMGIDGATAGFGASNDHIDWRGMNVILEYGNPHGSVCDLRDFAGEWLDLSALDLGSPEFNESLEVVTRQVTDANLAPSKPNGSALNQIRTNEKLFFPSVAGPTEAQSWMDANWQLSEFKLDEVSNLLKQVVVFNTPMNGLNAQQNLDFGEASGTFGTPSNSETTIASGYSSASALIDWVYRNKNRVLQGNFKLPESYNYSTHNFLGAAVAEMDAEFLHYWDLYWNSPSTNYYTQIAYGTVNLEAKELRHQFSLNTCQGCHGAETKTTFTQLRPVGYGQAINYWDPIPEDDESSLDIRTPYHDAYLGSPAQNKGNFAPANYGTSSVYFSPPNHHSTYNYYDGGINNEYYTNLQNAHFPRISGFLTGRAFVGSGQNATWYDDNLDQDDDWNDHVWNAPNQFYGVFDPSSGPESHIRPDKIFLYNDLQMRKQSLCNFVNADCTSGGILQIARIITQNVMMERGH